jgi:hypothetical protein
MVSCCQCCGRVNGAGGQDITANNNKAAKQQQQQQPMMAQPQVVVMSPAQSPQYVQQQPQPAAVGYAFPSKY